MRKRLAFAVLIAGLVSLQFTSAFAASTSGSLDTTFAGDGVAFLPQTASDVAVQPDGKSVVVGGATDRNGRGVFAVSRFNRDGTLDPSFSGNGMVRTRVASSAGAGAIEIQPNGRIIVGGRAETRNDRAAFAFVRYLPDGSLDTSFSGNGKLAAVRVGSMDVSEISDIKVDANGAIVASAYMDDGHRYLFGLIRLTRRGAIDPTFSSDGVVATRFGLQNEFAESVAIQPDGAIVAAGSADGRFALTRYAPDGTRDGSFGGDGKRTVAFGGVWSGVSDVGIQDDGGIVLAGTVHHGSANEYGHLSIALARCDPDGTLDGSFAGDGKRTTSLDGNLRSSSLAIQSDGKIVVGGEATPTVDEYPTNFALARYTTGGRLDTSFAGDGIQVTSFRLDDWIDAIALQPNGKIIAVGASQGRPPLGYAIARFLP